MPPLQLHNKKLHKETSYYSDMYAVKSIIDGSSDTETLRFILELNIQDFVNKRTMPRSYSLKEFDPLENDDDSFDEENPFNYEKFKEIWRETVKRHFRKWKRTPGILY